MPDLKQIPLLKVNQWLKSWELSDWAPDLPEPPHEFYIASVPLRLLRGLAGVSRRTIEDRKSVDKHAGYQRAHQLSRSKNIARYIQYGYPLSNQKNLDPEEHKKLVHPGWLPTSILVNIIQPGETRRRAGKDAILQKDQAIKISAEGAFHALNIPCAPTSKSNDKAPDLEPIEIIDGQHRLFAVDELGQHVFADDYEVPVVFFNGLTESWQAYLFWVINVEPRKINTSLAFDLYPELRSQSWLESGEGVKVYQEHRAQELTEVLWRHPSSPWKDRIELHGGRKEGHVSNAAFIRSLMVSFVRRWGKENRIGGLFGSIDGNGIEKVLPWKRSQQAAFLIACWTHLHNAVKKSDAPWVKALRSEREKNESLFEQSEFEKNTPFSGANTLLSTDQGCRVIFIVFNAMSQLAYNELELETWESDEVSDKPNDSDVSVALAEFSQLTKANLYLKNISEVLVNCGMDWRTSGAKSLDQSQSQMQAAYRGSSGYSLLQRECFKNLAASDIKLVAEKSKQAIFLQGNA
ncbi:MAG: DGQHR domain-containing protein [Pseudomonas putida]|jgi:DGQHR domain-containing protein|nr:DGQHR domain-containing protein [Pseudomonas putida]